MAQTDLLRSRSPDLGPTAADAAAAGFECPLCRRRFTAQEMACHHGCPLSRRCQVICCPNCGYEFVDTAQMRARVERWSGFWRRIFRRAA